MNIDAMTNGKGTASPASVNQTLGQFISALVQEVPDTNLRNYPGMWQQENA